MKATTTSALIIFLTVSTPSFGANWFARLIRGCIYGSPQSQPIPEPPEHFKVAEKLGLHVEPTHVVLVERAIENFLNKASIQSLEQELGGRNMLTGELRNPRTSITHDSTLRTPQKRAQLKEHWALKLALADSAILQVIRDEVEPEIGWGNLWAANFQHALNQRKDTNDLTSFSKSTSFFDGLLYAPGPEENTVRIYGDTYHDHPADLVREAIKKGAVEMTDVKIYQERKTRGVYSYSLKFSAVLKAPDKENPTGELVLEKNRDIEANEFLVRPFQVDQENIALSREDDSYILHFKKGYKYGARVDNKETVNGNDLDSVIESAASDSGLRKFVQVRNFDNGVAIRLGEVVPLGARKDFEAELALRVKELKSPKKARISRLKRIRKGIDPNIAEKSLDSGYDESLEDIQRLLTLYRVDGTSTYDNIWHPNYPRLTKYESVVKLSIDDRIYGHGQFAGPEMIAALQKARFLPMEPVRVGPRGPYLVLSEKTKFVLSSGYHEQYYIFKHEAGAQEFIRNHRFVRSE